jgi:hypothetical protein
LVFGLVALSLIVASMLSTNEILYIVDTLTCVMNNKFKIIILVGVLAVLCSSMYSTTMSTASAQLNYSIKVAKTSEGDFTVTNGASYVGSSFDTTYTMTGTALNFTKARDTLITSIIDDFDESSTIGYIKMNNTNNQSSGNITGLANPFVSQDQINQKIKSVLTYALDKIEHPVGTTPNVGDSRVIKCKFGNVLNDFWCDIPTFAIK